MNSKIFEIRAVQGAMFLLMQDDLSKFVSRNNLNEHQLNIAIKDLRLITYTKLPEPKFKDEA